MPSTIIWWSCVSVCYRISYTHSLSASRYLFKIQIHTHNNIEIKNKKNSTTPVTRFRMRLKRLCLWWQKNMREKKNKRPKKGFLNHTKGSTDSKVKWKKKKKKIKYDENKNIRMKTEKHQSGCVSTTKKKKIIHIMKIIIKNKKNFFFF